MKLSGSDSGNGAPGVDAILDALDAAETEADLEALVARHAHAVFRSFDLMQDLQRRAVEVAQDRPEMTRRILAFLDRVGRSQGRTDLQAEMMAVEGDEAIRSLIRAHSDEITPGFAASAIDEARRLLRQADPMGIVMADRVLRRGELMAEHLADDRLRADANFRRSEIVSRQGDHAAGAQLCLEAAQAYHRLGMTFEEAQATGQAGTLIIAAGRPEAAEPYLRRSLELLEGHPDAAALAAPTHEELAMIAGRAERLEEAAAHYLRAADLRRELGQPEREAADLRGAVVSETPADPHADDRIGRIARVERAIAATTQAPPRGAEAEELLDGFAQSIALGGFWPAVGTVFSVGAPAGKNDPELARRWMDAVAKVRPWLRDDTAIARAELVAAIEAMGADATDTVLSRVEAALAVLSSGYVGEHLAAAQIFADLAVKNGRAAAALEAIEGAEKRFALAREEPLPGPEKERQSYDKVILVSLLRLKAMALRELGRFDDALAAMEESGEVELDDDLWGHRYAAASLRSELAAVAFDLRDIERSVLLQLDLVRSARELGYRGGVAASITSLGIDCGMMAQSFGRDISQRRKLELVEMIVEEVPEAAPADTPAHVGRRLLEHALGLAEAAEDGVSAARIRGSLSNFQTDPRERLRTLQAAHAEFLAAGGTGSSEETILGNMGKAYRDLGDDEAAEVCLSHSLALSDRHRSYGWAYDTAIELSQLAIRKGGAGEAAKYLRRAIDYIELYRLALPEEDTTRVAFARGKVQAYENLVGLYAARGRAADAFDVLQQMKSRALLDAYARGMGERGDALPAAANLCEREAHLLDEMRSSREGERSKFDVLADLKRTYDELAAIDPSYAARRSGRALGFAALRDVLGAQQRRILLIDFFVHDNGGLAFLVRPEWDAPKVVALPGGAETLARLRREFERQVVRYRSRGPATWRAEAAQLLAPLAPHLEVGDLIYIVPHGPLHSLPIHLFPLGPAPLCDGHDVIYLPAASLLPLAERRRGGSAQLRSALCFGIDFVDEAEAVSRLFDESRVLVGPLTADAVTEAADGGADVIHFSAHGDYVPDAPELSGILIGGSPTGHAVDPATVLTSERISAMTLDAEILCLSACRSGLARLSQGDEQLGIQRACFIAGASSVISTLWPVEPRATQEFMVTFYRTLLGSWRADGRVDKPAALRAAQRALRDDPATAGEYFWAAFTLTGDWK